MYIYEDEGDIGMQEVDFRVKQYCHLSFFSKFSHLDSCFIYLMIRS